jgi:hypothetical protein
MQPQTATLIAAVIAAFASFIVLLLNLRAGRLGELRAAHRKTLEAHITSLGEAIHETVATSHILLMARTEVSVESWRERSQKAKAKFQELGPKLRYPLWGITDALRTLSRLPDWVEHARAKFPKEARIICDAGRDLSATLDRTIKDCYSEGRVPTLFERAMVGYRVWRFKRAYHQFQTGGRDDDDRNA